MPNQKRTSGAKKMLAISQRLLAVNPGFNFPGPRKGDYLTLDINKRAKVPSSGQAGFAALGLVVSLALLYVIFFGRIAIPNCHGFKKRYAKSGFVVMIGGIGVVKPSTDHNVIVQLAKGNKVFIGEHSFGPAGREVVYTGRHRTRIFSRRESRFLCDGIWARFHYLREANIKRGRTPVIGIVPTPYRIAFLGKCFLSGGLKVQRHANILGEPYYWPLVFNEVFFRGVERLIGSCISFSGGAPEGNRYASINSDHNERGNGRSKCPPVKFITLILFGLVFTFVVGWNLYDYGDRFGWFGWWCLLGCFLGCLGLVGYGSCRLLICFSDRFGERSEFRQYLPQENEQLIPTSSIIEHQIAGPLSTRRPFSHCRPLPHGPIVSMSLKMVLPTRRAIEVKDLLRQFIFSLCRHYTSTLWKDASSEAPASPSASASSYRVSKDVCVLPVVIAELKFRKIERQVLFADVVIGSDDPALEQAPKIVNICRVDISPDVLMTAVVNGLVPIAHVIQRSIASGIICGYQFNIVTHGLTDKVSKRLRAGVLNHFANHVSLAGNRADNSDLAATARNMTPLVCMAILVLATEIGFVHFNDAHEFKKVGILHRSAKPVAEIPRGLVGTGADLPVNLESAHALLAVEHRIENLKPRSQRILGVFHDSAGQKREAVASLAALRALPVSRTLQRVHFLVAATRALNARRPAMGKDVLTAGFFRRERFHQLLQRHHMNHLTPNKAICQVLDNRPVVYPSSGHSERDQNYTPGSAATKIAIQPWVFVQLC